MQYILIGDDCDNCLYTSHTFTLLRLPLKKCSLDELNNYTKDATDISLLVCNHIESQHKKQINKFVKTKKIPLILFNKTAINDYANLPVSYLNMPFSEYELQNVLSACTNIKHGNMEFLPAEQQYFEKLVGHSKHIHQIKSLIKQVAETDTTVLILGQSGTGKDVIASCIHNLSHRKDHPFVPINCGAIPSELMESELFGHEKGAFTGALARRAGRFEMANRGTLFLDEIGDMPLPMQVKLLRVIQERKFERVGGNTSINIDTRLIAATNQNLEDLIQSNHFREDLYYRINVFPIYVPCLHERAEDIPLLIDYLIEKVYERLKHRVMFTDRAKEMLSEYEWPGNIRELQNFVERMMILYPDRAVNEKDIEPALKQRKSSICQQALLPKKTPFNMKDYIAKIEQQIIEHALEQSNGLVSAAADYLSLGRTALMDKIKKYHMQDHGLKILEEEI